MPYKDLILIQIHVGPTETQNFTLPHARCKGQNEESFQSMPFYAFKEGLCLFGCHGLNYP
jgi:hypothetical protein